MTYSLVARDPGTGDLGVAAQSHFFALGPLVTWAEPGVGAVATQSFAEPAYGPRGLALMGDGRAASVALDTLVGEDPHPELRQVAMVDASGGSAAHTGAGCVAAAGHRVGEGLSGQANMVAAPAVWEDMVRAFDAAGGDLPARLLAGLEAAEAAGGDMRGRQSAALLVVSGERTERPWEGVKVDLRVDDHPDPLAELRRLLDHRRAFDLIGRALFIPGVVTGPFAVDEVDVDATAAELSRAQELLGANPEPTMWRAVLLARAGRLAEAREDLARAARATPRLVEFYRRLVDAGFLPAELGSVGQTRPDEGHRDERSAQ
jgi:uncharacterized Ntn-hydrolase superfamily protein